MEKIKYTAKIISETPSHVSFSLFVNGANVSEYICLTCEEFEDLKMKLNLNYVSYKRNDLQKNDTLQMGKIK
jgi:hypothetical protein